MLRARVHSSAQSRDYPVHIVNHAFYQRLKAILAFTKRFQKGSLHRQKLILGSLREQLIAEAHFLELSRVELTRVFAVGREDPPDIHLLMVE